VAVIAGLPVIADKPLKDILPANKFPKGWCTSYLASKRRITWRGNAGDWFEAAKAQGYEVGSEARIGAIYVTRAENSRGCRYCGHVAYVEDVGEAGVKLSEMNYVGFGKISYRTVSYEELAQKRVGFIY
jgi:surface antigen